MDNQLNFAPCGYITLSSDGVIKTVNQTLLNLLDYKKEELLDKHLESILSNKNKFLLHTYFYPHIRLYNHLEEMFLSIIAKNGQEIPILLNARSYTDNKIEYIDCILINASKRIQYEKEIRDIKMKLEETIIEKDNAIDKLEILFQDNQLKQKELISLNAKLKLMATSDMLTGLKNRRFFQESLSNSIDIFFKQQKIFSLLIIDIDYFKQINDNFGHLVGDQTLVEVAKILESVSRKVDVISRFGGEEFAIILPNTDKLGAKKAAEKLRLAVDNGHWNNFHLTVSIGASTFTNLDTEQSILNKADKALYTSKNYGRNRITHSDELANQTNQL